MIRIILGILLICFAVGLGFTWLATVPPTATIVGKLFGVRHLSTLFGLTLLSHQIGGFLGAWLGGALLGLAGAMAHAPSTRDIATVRAVARQREVCGRVTLMWIAPGKKGLGGARRRTPPPSTPGS